MHIPSNKILKSNADLRLSQSGNARKVVLIYSGIITAMALLVTVVNYCLGLQISQMGGLSNMGMKSVLSTIQSVLPMIQSAVMLCLNIGYLAAMMRVTREQYMSAQTLKLGFERFWLLLRVTILLYGVYLALCLAASWIAAQLYMFSPFSGALIEILTPYVSGTSMNMDFLLDEIVYAQVMNAMIPMLVLFGVIYLAFLTPFWYSYRMVNYLIVDHPGMGALAVLRESKRMMKGHRMRLFKLDVSLWWWYLLSAALTVVAYGDTILSAMGVTLPFSADVGYFLFYFLFLAGQFAVFCFLSNRVEVTYAQVYEKLRPREENNGAVLGNIFQM